MKEDVSKTVGEERDAIIDFLRDLVQIPSVTGDEKAAQEFVSKTLREMGLAVDVWEMDQAGLSPPPGLSYTGRPNVVGVWKGVGDGRSIILNGHVDVTPVGDTAWKHDPWGASIEGNKLFGRGACDMKGGCAAMIMAVRILREMGVKLKGDVIIESVIEEERTGNGTLACSLRGYSADAGIVTEPSSCKISPGTTGLKWLKTIVRGRATHPSDPNGVDAVRKSMKIIEAIDSLSEWRKMKKRYPPFPPETSGTMPIITYQTTGIQAVNWIEEVTFQTRVPFMPGEIFEETQKEIEDWILAAASTDPWLREHPPKLEWKTFVSHPEPSAIPEDHPIAQTLKTAFKDATGKETGFTSYPAADARILNNIDPKTPTVVFGPGDLFHAHIADEWVSTDEVADCTKILALTLIDWCGVE